MTQIKKVKTSEGVQFYPQTHTKAVIDDNGYTAESRLGAMQDEINNLQEGVVVVGEGVTPVPSDLTPTEDSTNWVTSGGVFNAIKSVNQKFTHRETCYSLDTSLPSKQIYTITSSLDLENGQTYIFNIRTKDSSSLSAAVGFYLKKDSSSTGIDLIEITAGKIGETFNFTANDDYHILLAWSNVTTEQEFLITIEKDVSIKEVLEDTDQLPTKESKKLVTSGGVYAFEPVTSVTLSFNTDNMTKSNCSLVSDGTWGYSQQRGAKHIVIPCKEGDEFTLLVTSTQATGGWTAWLTSSYVAPSDGDTVPYVAGQGRVWRNKDTEISITAPTGAAYLCVCTTDGDGKVSSWTITQNTYKTLISLIDDKVSNSDMTNQKVELENEIEASKYSMTPYTDVWSTTNASIISYEKDGEDAVITVTSKTGWQRCGFSIADVKVGEKIYVDFTSNIGVPFGVGETLSSTWVWLNGQSYKSSFYFTKTSSTQKYIYIAANSFDSGTVIRLVGFKVYKAAGFSEFDFRIAKLESHDFYPSSYIPIKEKYETYMSISGSQGSTIYGNNFVQGFEKNTKISIYNLETKTKVQDITLPTFGNTRFHANTISFSGTKYDSGDDFPLLYICAGCVNTNNPTISEVYVVRIVGTSGEYTSELVQTINLAFSTWTEFVCDPVRNRAWINGSGIARYICVAIPDITESEVTIDANTAIIDKFDTKSFVLGTTTKSSGQGRFFYHNRVYYVSGVPNYAGEGVEALYVVVDNVLTHCTEAVVPLMNFGLTGEPEGCFIWKDEFYVAYRGSIVKLIQN